MLVSSAKSMESKAFDTLYKSLMYNKNNKGPKIHPKIDMYVTEVWHTLYRKPNLLRRMVSFRFISLTVFCSVAKISQAGLS